MRAAMPRGEVRVVSANSSHSFVQQAPYVSQAATLCIPCVVSANSSHYFVEQAHDP